MHTPDGKDSISRLIIIAYRVNATLFY